MTALDQRRDVRIKTVAKGFNFLEAPRWHGGHLYFSDFFAHRVYSMNPGGRVVTVCEVPGQPSGLGFTPTGDLVVVSMLDQRLLTLRDGSLSELADLDSLFDGPANDLVIDRNGRAFVGNFGSDVYGGAPEASTCLVRVDSDRSVQVVARNLDFPNGMAITSDGTLLVAESLACRITAFDLDDAGDLSNRRVWASFEPRPEEPTFAAALDCGAVIPDGICVDAEDALWIADSGGHAVYRIAAGGAVLDSISCGSMSAYAVALGGPDGRSLFICAGPAYGTYDPTIECRGELWVTSVNVPGPLRGPDPVLQTS